MNRQARVNLQRIVKEEPASLALQQQGSGIAVEKQKRAKAKMLGKSCYNELIFFCVLPEDFCSLLMAPNLLQGLNSALC